MKKSSFLALALAPMILGAPMAATAQSVSTDPVGFVKSPLNDGSYTPVGVNLTKAPVYGAMVASSTSNSITASDGSADIGSLLGAGTYYVELTSGALEGDRIDIASATGNVITLNTGAAHNTISDASAIPADSTFLIREHFTFADLSDGIGGTSLLGGTGPANSDQILTYESGGFKIHFLGSDGNWYDASNFAVVNGKPVVPGAGVLFYANPAAGGRTLELLVLGSVRNNDVVVPLNQGFQVVSTGFPMDLSPADLAMTTEFFTGGTGPSNADQILTFQDGGFKIHFLGTDSNWYAASDFSVVTNSPLFGDQKSVLVFRNTADPDFRVANQLQ